MARDHRLVPSSPVIPYDDPTLLFVNAGMNQFKDVYTGQRKVDYSRATSTQKCMRAGGKHNDLDNVGFTARHNTFFEMLGNFSFGDYFKEEAISYAWEWITKELKLPIEKLWVSVYKDDDDAFALWEKIAPELKNGRILRFDKKDNYWSMGDTGPCGPCSEIHFDRGEKFGTGPDDVVNGETERFVEFWNLVFLQFDQLSDGSVVPLPKPSIDTGLGLERIAAIMQNVGSNYEIDLFTELIKAVSDITHARYEDHVASHRVIADHLRALTFAIADGAGISNEGQGYVLRRILRRAARHGRLLGASEPFIYKLVPALVEQMGDAYPEIREKQGHVEKVIRAEEESFGRTLETGLVKFEEIAKRTRTTGSKVVDGMDAFTLYDTYGFPFDLTEIMAAEHGLKVDDERFEQAMDEQRKQSRASAAFQTDLTESEKRVIGELVDSIAGKVRPTEFVRESLAIETTVVASMAPSVGLVLERTPFYVEAGGQTSDTGVVSNETTRVQVTAVEKYGDYFIHLGTCQSGSIGDLAVGSTVTAEVDTERRWDIMRNHTATHLAHAALRQVLGEHIKQSGSYVGPDRLRFDFSHHQPMTPREVHEVETIVNNQILLDTSVKTMEMPVEEAKKTGAMALFGEKYGDKVRVVSVDDFSRELCGGTHVDSLGQIGPFLITLETGIASGVRRMEAITGRAAIERMLALKQFRSDVVSVVGRQEGDALGGVKALKEQAASLQKELKKTKTEMFSGSRESVGRQLKVGAVTVMTHEFGETDRDIMSGWIDSQKEQASPTVAIAIGFVNGKATYMAAASHTAVTEQAVHIGKLSKQLLALFGGRGGGKPTFAQGTVANNTVAQKLFDTAITLIGKGKTTTDA